MTSKFTFLRVDKTQIPSEKLEHFYGRGQILDLDIGQVRNLFLMKEASDRGFFLDSSLSQLSQGQSQLPLLTWSFLDYLATRKTCEQNLVELGSGNSTLWLSQRFSKVISYETSPQWADEITKVLPANASINLVNLEVLEAAQVDLQLTDWLLIDFAGRRTRFINNMLKRGINPNHIILDNADWYRNGASLLIEAGYTEIPFFGFKSGQTWISCTSLFLRELPSAPGEGEFCVPENCRVTRNSWDRL
jgi:hypothetical protein